MSAVIEKQNQVRPEPTPRFVAPAVNIFEGKDAYIIEADIPGVNREGLEVTVEGTELTIVGRRQRDERAETLYQESHDADYQRAFELDPAIDTSKIEASIEQGLLTLRLPKSEKAKPHKITVTE